jgi:hypothetical protein
MIDFNGARKGFRTLNIQLGKADKETVPWHNTGAARQRAFDCFWHD